MVVGIHNTLRTLTVFGFTRTFPRDFRMRVLVFCVPLCSCLNLEVCWAGLQEKQRGPCPTRLHPGTGAFSEAWKLRSWQCLDSVFPSSLLPSHLPGQKACVCACVSVLVRARVCVCMYLCVHTCRGRHRKEGKRQENNLSNQSLS